MSIGEFLGALPMGLKAIASVGLAVVFVWFILAAMAMADVGDKE